MNRERDNDNDRVRGRGRDSDRDRQPDLYVSDRPVRSDFDDEEVNYARRRIITVMVLAAVICGSIYAFWGGSGALNPADIPTIGGDMNYKDKPANPGGIDIPHQDVKVYEKLEGKGVGQGAVEHLLPPPETPKDYPRAETPRPAETTAQSTAQPSPQAVAEAPAPQAAPMSSVQSTAAPKLDAAPAAKVIATTMDTSTANVTAVQSAPAKTPAKAAPSSIEQIIKNTSSFDNEPSAAAPKEEEALAKENAPAASGKAVVQLASVPDKAKADQVLAELKRKYAVELSGVTLRLERADLGAKGTYYRVQSQGLAEQRANQLCSALKKKNAGCILVRK